MVRSAFREIAVATRVGLRMEVAGIHKAGKTSREGDRDNPSEREPCFEWHRRGNGLRKKDVSKVKCPRGREENAGLHLGL